MEVFNFLAKHNITGNQIGAHYLAYILTEFELFDMTDIMKVYKKTAQKFNNKSKNIERAIRYQKDKLGKTDVSVSQFIFVLKKSWEEAR